MNNENTPKRNRNMGPGPNRGGGEKPKNFKNAVVRLVKELKNFKVLVIISLILASLSSIISIMAPDKLSELTDEISKGLVVNSENLEEITEKTCFSRMGIAPIFSGVKYKKMLEYIVQKYSEYAIPAIENITSKITEKDIEELFEATRGITKRSEAAEELSETDEYMEKLYILQEEVLLEIY